MFWKDFSCSYVRCFCSSLHTLADRLTEECHSLYDLFLKRFGKKEACNSISRSICLPLFGEPLNIEFDLISRGFFSSYLVKLLKISDPFISISTLLSYLPTVGLFPRVYTSKRRSSRNQNIKQIGSWWMSHQLLFYCTVFTSYCRPSILARGAGGKKFNL